MPGSAFCHKLVQRKSAGTLTAVTVNDNSLVRPVGIIHRDNIKLGKNTENFIELLIEDVQAPSAMHATAYKQYGSPFRFVPSAK